MNSPVLLIAIPLLMAFLSTMLKRLDKVFLSLGVIVNLSLLYFIEKGSYYIGGFKPPFGINLLLDEYSYFGVLILNIVFALALYLSYKSIDKYAVVLLISLAALNGMILTQDLFNLFVFIEIASIAAYILSSISKKYRFSFNYLVLGTLGSGLYLFGIIILYNIFGTLNMSDINNIISSSSKEFNLLLPLLLIFLGLSVEAKLLPFNGWVKGVYKNANGLVGAIFASGYALTIMLVLGRLVNKVFVLDTFLKQGLLLLGLGTLIFAEFAAFSRKSIKEILLYSSIAQSGLVTVLFLNNYIYAGLLVLLNNVIAKLIMFIIIGKFKDETGTDDYEELKGIFAKYKLIGFGFSIATLSVIGLPLFYGFVAKISALMSFVEDGNLIIPMIILFVSVIEGAYFIRLITKLWNPAEENNEASNELIPELSVVNSKRFSYVIVIIGAILLVTGIFPNIVSNSIEAISNSLNSFVPSFISNIMGGI